MKRLPAEARIHRHHQDLVEIAEHRLDVRRRRRRIQHRAGTRAALADLRERAVQVRTRLDLHADRRGAGPREVGDVLLGLDDHQVHVERKLRRALHGLDDDRTDRDVGDEAAVHHVDVHPVGAGLLDRRDLVGEAAEVGRQDRRRDDDAPAHERRSRRAEKKPSVSWRCGQQRSVASSPTNSRSDAGTSDRGRAPQFRRGREQPLHHVVVLLGTERAGTVDERSARPQAPRRRSEDRSLHLGELRDRVGLNAPARVGIAAQRAESGAGRVDEDAVEGRVVEAVDRRRARVGDDGPQRQDRGARRRARRARGGPRCGRARRRDPYRRRVPRSPWPWHPAPRRRRARVRPAAGRAARRRAATPRPAPSCGRPGMRDRRRARRDGRASGRRVRSEQGAADGNRSRNSASRASRVVRRRFARTVRGGVALSAVASAAASAGPYAASQRSASQRGNESECTRCASGSSARVGSAIVSRSRARRRRAAFTRPAARPRPVACASRTDSETAAASGTRSQNTIW